MKGFAAVARREIVQHRDLILGALFAGILAAGVPLLPRGAAARISSRS